MISFQRVNGFIRASNVRLIDEDGNQIGIFATYQAIEKAKEVGMDLVEVNSKTNPPVCKIMDFGKLKYEQKKKEKEIAKSQRKNSFDIKEISVRPSTVEHDLKIKAENYIQRWLTDGNKVRIVVAFKGREFQHPEIGTKVVNSMLGYLTQHSFVIEEQNISDGRHISYLIAPT